MSHMDIDLIRQEFPSLEAKVNGHNLIYLDNTATTQTPRCVVEAIERMYYTSKANVHRGVHHLSQVATGLMESARADVAQFINAPSPEQIIFTRGTTEAINLVASSYGGAFLEDGDEVLITVMEHHANIVPWQLLQRGKRITIKAAGIRPDGSLDMDDFRRLLTPRTRIVAVCHVSNVLGTVNPVAEIIDLAHCNGSVTLIDGAQASAHIPIDVQALDADFYVFSSHKMYGPTGIGVLYGHRELLEQMPPYQGGGEMIAHVSLTEGTTFAPVPLKFEAGTPDFVGIAAFAEALRFIGRLGLDNIAAHEEELLHYATERMLEIPGMRIFGTAPGKSAIISFLIGRAHHFDIGTLLDQLGVAVRTGHHCAQPLMQSLGITGTVRASMAVYNTRDEVDRFIAALHRIAPMLE